MRMKSERPRNTRELLPSTVSVRPSVVAGEASKMRLSYWPSQPRMPLVMPSSTKRDIQLPAVAQPRHSRRPNSAKRVKLQSAVGEGDRSEEHTSELQSLMRISYAVFCLKKKKTLTTKYRNTH